MITTERSFLALLHDHFTDNEIKKASHYARSGRVRGYHLEQYDNNLIFVTGRVQGTRRAPYVVTILIRDSENIEGDCSCPMEVNCKHVATILIRWQMDSPRGLFHTLRETSKTVNLNEDLKSAQQRWIEAIQKTASLEKKPEHVVEYVLDLPRYLDNDSVLKISNIAYQKLKKGGLGKPKELKKNANKTVHIPPDDRVLRQKLAALCGHDYRDTFILSFNSDGLILKEIITTGRCYWRSPENKPLYLDETPISAKFEWFLNADASQTLRCVDEKGATIPNLIPLNPIWSIDSEHNRVRPVHIDLPTETLKHLLQTPELPVSCAKAFVNEMAQRLPQNTIIPVPKVFDAVEQRKIKPTIALTVEKKGSPDYPVMATDLDIRYGNHTLHYDETDQNTLLRVDGNSLIQIARHFEEENIQILKLQNGFDNNHIPVKAQNPAAPLTNEYSSIHDIVHFGESVIPKLKELGLTVDFDSSDFYSLEEPGEWYTELDEESDLDWFSLDMGVMVKGDKVSLLPYLIEAIEHLKFNENEKHYYINLHSGQVLPVPIEKLQKITNVVTQFVDPNRLESNNHSLRISRYKASLLADMEKALESSKSRWLGGERLLDLGRRLRQFKKIKTVTPPKKLFLAELRDYQKKGVSWLQFLREYELNGILADDMGLGKTLQTLAHILIEKQKKRLSKPCLIIAPTSVIYNWEHEASRFTPSLSVLLLRGDDRKTLFNAIPQHDVVLSTYPLVVRDKETLLSHDYHLLILDEAQTIKNAQAKMTQIIQQIKATHRLCLTGTPLENHLGELWSLFHFLMPGLLGSQREFKQLYRTPIEKDQDPKALSRLTTLIKPFMLRRKKRDVLNDLPEKTEIIKTISFTHEQRDLYEAIRLSMHKKVRDAVDKQGIERSQIIILDALLKLRQVCCDPQLVKLDAAKKVSESAKLDTLLTMLDHMIPEGRRILIFSQFTSMLSIIEKQLKQEKIAYVKLTGATKNRTTPVERFQSGDVPVFLISLKSGGTGINLTAADTVIHYDPWWNPAVESQATDRSHRIGQKNPVFVYKLVSENTVEEKIIAMQAKKKQLMESLFTGNNKKTSITKADLTVLLGGDT